MRETVKSSSIFGTLQDEEIGEVLKITEEKNFQKGEVIMQEGGRG